MDRKEAMQQWAIESEKIDAEIAAFREVLTEIQERLSAVSKGATNFHRTDAWGIAADAVGQEIVKLITMRETIRSGIEDQIDDGFRMFPSDGGDI